MYPFPVFASAAVIETPGAAMSGFNLVSNVGPLLLKLAISPVESSTAATVTTFQALPGHPTVHLPGPLFPAATATNIPASHAASTA